jgi:type IV secretion system protein VirD4
MTTKRESEQVGALVPQPRVRLKRQSPYLGFFVDPDAPANAPGFDLRYHGQKHLLTFGTPGANKSMGLVVPNLATLRRSMIVIDPKGQLCAITKRAREKMGRVIVINPFGELVDVRPDMQSGGWNPLLQLDPESPDFESDARCISEAIVDRSTDSKSDFFESSMENLWTVFAMWERRTNGSKASLRNIRSELSMPIKVLLQTLKTMAESDDYAMQVAGGRAYARLTDANSQSTSMQDVIETIMKNTAFLNDQRIGTDMKIGGGIDFGDMHKQITTVYVVLPVNQLRKQAKWLRMFVNLALSDLFKAPPRVATLPPVLFMLDEFGNLGRLPEILNAMNIARDYRIQLWMFLQNLEQLKASYPKEWTYFFAGSGAITTFSARDWETAEHFSKLFGKREVEMTSQNRSGGHPLTGYLGKNASIGESTSTHVFPLIEPEDLWRLGKGGTANFIEPCPWPVRAEAQGYWDIMSPNQLGELDPNPYFHG